MQQHVKHLARAATLQRSGTTLTEVLIAVFVVGIGLLSILTLFPLGALSMAQAIKDDRCAQANKDGAALARLGFYEMLPEIPNLLPFYPLYNPAVGRNADPLLDAMINPNANPQNQVIPAPFRTDTAAPSTTPILFLPPFGPNAANQFYQVRYPSYPVFVDMIGWNNNAVQGMAHKYWIGGQVGNAATGQPASIPRRTLRLAEFFVSSPVNVNPRTYAPYLPAVRTAFMHRYFVQTDDLGWGQDATVMDTNGVTPANSGTPLAGSVQRDGRYNWAFMLRRPQINQPRQAELTIVVYSGRSVDTPFDENGDWAEKAYPNAVFVQGSTEAVIDYGAGPRPKIRRGTWILDATMSRRLTNGQYQPEPHGYFYRVVDVNDETPGQLRLTLQQPARESTVLQNGQGYGLAVVMQYVAEVFERNTLSPTVMPVP